MSEIDDIFRSKGKAKAVPLSAPTSDISPIKKKKKDKKKKKKRDTGGGHHSPVTKHPPPDTTVDPSTKLRATKRNRLDSDTTAPSKRTKTIAELREDKQFRDSRGTGPRQKTDEGWYIYKEEELGLTGGGGDTHLCPFDCNCCF